MAATNASTNPEKKELNLFRSIHNRLVTTYSIIARVQRNTSTHSPHQVLFETTLENVLAKYKPGSRGVISTIRHGLYNSFYECAADFSTAYFMASGKFNNETGNQKAHCVRVANWLEATSLMDNAIVGITLDEYDHNLRQATENVKSRMDKNMPLYMHEQETKKDYFFALNVDAQIKKEDKVAANARTAQIAAETVELILLHEEEKQKKALEAQVKIDADFALSLVEEQNDAREAQVQADAVFASSLVTAGQ